jgi:hypothetical protein
MGVLMFVWFCVCFVLVVAMYAMIVQTIAMQSMMMRPTTMWSIATM